MTWERNCISDDSECRGLLRPRRGLDGVEAGDLLTNLIDEAVHDHIDSDADRIGEAERVGTAMALDRDAIEAKQHRTVVAPRIHALAHLLQGVGGEEIAYSGEDGMLEGGPQELAEEPRRAFRRLEGDIAGEAIGDDDIDGPGGNVVAFDEAVELDRRIFAAQLSRGGAYRVMALQILGADIEQPDR